MKTSRLLQFAATQRADVAKHHLYRCTNCTLSSLKVI